MEDLFVVIGFIVSFSASLILLALYITKRQDCSGLKMDNQALLREQNLMDSRIEEKIKQLSMRSLDTEGIEEVVRSIGGNIRESNNERVTFDQWGTRYYLNLNAAPYFSIIKSGVLDEKIDRNILKATVDDVNQHSYGHVEIVKTNEEIAIYFEAGGIEKNYYSFKENLPLYMRMVEILENSWINTYRQLEQIKINGSNGNTFAS